MPGGCRVDVEQEVRTNLGIMMETGINTKPHAEVNIKFTKCPI